MSKKTNSLGQQGEEIAAAYLQRQGYSIIKRNYSRAVGELDIIAEYGQTLVFVEVKTRKNSTYGSPFEAITTKKQLQLSKIALQYLVSHKQTERDARFDIIAVIMIPGQDPAIEHLQNGFDLCYGL